MGVFRVRSTVCGYSRSSRVEGLELYVVVRACVRARRGVLECVLQHVAQRDVWCRFETSYGARVERGEPPCAKGAMIVVSSGLGVLLLSSLPW